MVAKNYTFTLVYVQKQIASDIVICLPSGGITEFSAWEDVKWGLNSSLTFKIIVETNNSHWCRRKTPKTAVVSACKLHQD